MNQLINFDDWQVDEDSPFGSGASEKKWLINIKTKQKGIFKFPKELTTGELTGESYSINMILNSIKGTELEDRFLTIPIFDALIGNSDRHHSNWGIVKNNISGNIRISPLYVVLLQIKM